jgi:hypothetical protein
MPKRKHPEEDPNKQFERFMETAREHGVETGEAEHGFRELSKSMKAKDKSPKSCPPPASSRSKP